MRAHLRDSDSPIVEGNTITANCGKDVPNARIVLMWDAQEVGRCLTIPTRGVCRKCFVIPPTERYVYGIVSGMSKKLAGLGDD